MENCLRVNQDSIRNSHTKQTTDHWAHTKKHISIYKRWDMVITGADEIKPNRLALAKLEPLHGRTSRAIEMKTLMLLSDYYHNPQKAVKVRMTINDTR